MAGWEPFPLGIGGTAFAVIGGIRWRGPFANGQLGGAAARCLRIGPEQRLQTLALGQANLGLRNTRWLLLSHRNNSYTQPHAKQHSGNRTNRGRQASSLNGAVESLQQKGSQGKPQTEQPPANAKR